MEKIIACSAPFTLAPLNMVAGEYAWLESHRQWGIGPICIQRSNINSKQLMRDIKINRWINSFARILACFSLLFRHPGLRAVWSYIAWFRTGVLIRRETCFTVVPRQTRVSSVANAIVATEQSGIETVIQFQCKKILSRFPVVINVELTWWDWFFVV